MSSRGGRSPMSRQVAIGLQYAAVALVVLIGGVALAPCFSGRLSNGSAPADPSAADRELLSVWTRIDQDVGYLLMPSGEGGRTAAHDQRVLDRLLGVDASITYWRLFVTNFSPEDATAFELAPGTLTLERDAEPVGNVDVLQLAGELPARDRLILRGLGAEPGRYELPPLASRGFLLALPGELSLDEAPKLRTENGEVALKPRRLPRGEIEDYLERADRGFHSEAPAGETSEALEPQGENDDE